MFGNKISNFGVCKFDSSPDKSILTNVGIFLLKEAFCISGAGFAPPGTSYIASAFIIPL